MTKTLKIKDGQTVASVAAEHGFYWQTIWDHQENAKLKKKRGNPDILNRDDKLFVPDITPKQEQKPSQKRHHYKRNGVPSRLRIRLMEDELPEGEPETPALCTGYWGDAPEEPEEAPSLPLRPVAKPRASVKCQVDIEGHLENLTSDGDGYIEVTVPAGAKRGLLMIDPGTEDEETHQLALGYLDPVTEVTGVKQRLMNLGYFFSEPDDKENAKLEEAVKRFQWRYELDQTGSVDDTTRDKLKEIYGQ